VCLCAGRDLRHAIVGLGYVHVEWVGGLLSWVLFVAMDRWRARFLDRNTPILTMRTITTNIANDRLTTVWHVVPSIETDS
jgi:hypothetical protein